MAHNAESNNARGMPVADTSAAREEQNDKPCLLLELSGELRNEIYSFTLSFPDGFTLDYDTSQRSRANVLALTMTCKQIRQECGELFFELNEICFNGQLLNSLASLHRRANRQAAQHGIDQLCNHVIYDNHLEAKLRYLHLSLGQCFVTPMRIRRVAIGPWAMVSEIVSRLSAYGVQVRLSFNLTNGTDLIVPYDFLITNEGETLAAMDRCFRLGTVDHRVLRRFSRIHNDLREEVRDLTIDFELVLRA